MTRTRLFLPGLVLLLVTGLLLSTPAFVNAERDPLAPVVDMPSPQVQTIPDDLFTNEQRASLAGVVNEARLFGVPLVVRVITMPTSLQTLSDATALTGVVPTQQEIVQRMAETWLADEAVETSEGAGDGILLLVVVPENDHTLSTAAFATGPNALPLNGLTEEHLDRVLHDVIYPFFANDHIATGIHSGVAYLSYDNLFAVPARHQRSDQQQTLNDITSIAFTGLALIGVIALGGLVFWIRRRDPHSGQEADQRLSPFEAGALTRGRVDTNVITAALLHLITIGALRVHMQKSGKMVLAIQESIPVADSFARDIMQRLAQEAGEDGLIQGASMRRIQDVLSPVGDHLQDSLATRNLFNRDARVETTWVVLASAALAAFAVFLLMPSMMAMSRLGLAAMLMIGIAVVASLLWAARRSWTSRVGQRALAEWQARPHSATDLAIFDTIIHQHVLIDAIGGPDVPSHIQITRRLRALGAG